MSHQDDHNQQELERIFGNVRRVEFEASPYLATRVLARLREDRAARKQLWFWRIFAGTAVAVGALVLLLNTRSVQQSTGAPAAVIAQAYVIHVDFDPTEVASVEEVEVELPEGVKFYSKSRGKELEGVRKLKLPLTRSLAGRNKLPFVVQSTVAGEQNLKVRLFGADGNLIRERLMSVNFKSSGKTVTL